jgi:hypothetical protein
MHTGLLAHNWALVIASVFALAISVFVLYRLHEESGHGRLARRHRELFKVKKEQAAARSSLAKAEQRLLALREKADRIKPRLLSEGEEAVQDARLLVTITGDQVLRAEKILRDVILEDFPPNRQDVLRNKYL